MKEKKCSKCNKTKPIAEFAINRRSKPGKCRACVNAYRREKYKREHIYKPKPANPDVMAEIYSDLATMKW